MSRSWIGVIIGIVVTGIILGSGISVFGLRAFILFCLALACVGLLIGTAVAAFGVTKITGASVRLSTTGQHTKLAGPIITGLIVAAVLSALFLFGWQPWPEGRAPLWAWPALAMLVFMPIALIWHSEMKNWVVGILGLSLVLAMSVEWFRSFGEELAKTAVQLRVSNSVLDGENIPPEVAKLHKLALSMRFGAGPVNQYEVPDGGMYTKLCKTNGYGEHWLFASDKPLTFILSRYNPEMKRVAIEKNGGINAIIPINDPTKVERKGRLTMVYPDEQRRLGALTSFKDKCLIVFVAPQISDDLPTEPIHLPVTGEAAEALKAEAAESN